MLKFYKKRNIEFSGNNCSEIIEELCHYLRKLPDDTVSLLPTRNMCNILNTFILHNIESEEILLIADDSFQSPKYLQKKVLKVLEKEDTNVCNACGIDRVITIKIDRKIMRRRNIDVSIGLVNGNSYVNF